MASMIVITIFRPLCVCVEPSRVEAIIIIMAGMNLAPPFNIYYLLFAICALLDNWLFWTHNKQLSSLLSSVRLSVRRRRERGDCPMDYLPPGKGRR